MSRRTLLATVTMMGLAAGLTGHAVLAQPPAGAAAERPPAAPPPPAPLFFRETWHRGPGDSGEHPILPSNVSDPDLALEALGVDAKDIVVGGTDGGPGSSTALNLWSGLTTSPIAVLLRDRNHFVDLTGRARIRWVIRSAGFHAVRPVIRLADGTLLVGDHADSSSTIFAERDFGIADIRWLRLDPTRVVTIPNRAPPGPPVDWYPNPDLSRVDAVGWADLMPGSGHGMSGWINVSTFEVYGRSVARD